MFRTLSKSQIFIVSTYINKLLINNLSWLPYAFFFKIEELYFLAKI